MQPAPPFIHAHPLPYQHLLQARALTDIDLVVIHCTELPDLAMAREYGERVLYASGTGNSGHFYIDRDGRIEQYVALERCAHHVSGYNPRSVGIELVNRGRYPHWLAAAHQQMDEPYPQAQIDALLALLAHLRGQLPALAWIAGHEDLDQRSEPASDDPTQRVLRKRDPGPLFPWPTLIAATPLQRLPLDQPDDAAPL
ncbi:N-acetylmuramoyl-L-alanine amidase [Pseudoxanthomonas dokdonensis]|uniref:N-acetylmuramoyl-L-alanine amidase n=1 Tax=Pseudoxanthomonas dokdonensis TaxID=344882 RepID=A0A0R0CVN1_9GAMM|nr:N-acetylmuramoyl-L-alanine amidase [Pseudoxanthomonas dokdonensis]KRG69809.1 N-acetylmuramoyl-L-alanine amidase [Pseudoxanthomonas dokdonensis]